MNEPSGGARQQDQEPAAQAPDADKVISVQLNVTVRRRHIKLAVIAIALTALLITMAVTNPDLDDLAEHHLAEVKRVTEDEGALLRCIARWRSPSVARRQARRTNLLFLSVFWWKNPDGKEVPSLGAFGCIWGFWLKGKP